MKIPVDEARELRGFHLHSVARISRIMIIVLILLMLCNHIEGSCRTLKIKTILEDEALTNHTIRTIQPITDYVTCLSRCFLESLCFGVNFCVEQDSTARCELTDSDHIRSEKDLVEKPGCTFYGSKSGCSSDPCANYNATCQADFLEDTPSYRCNCSAGQECPTDIDECALNTHICHVDATCDNTVGGYNCTCKPGFYGNGTSCYDIDECDLGVHGCNEFANCTNFPGGHNCTCKAGFHGDGKVCVDLDECTLNAHECHVNATCNNTFGGYTCQCHEGLLGNGTFCRYPKNCVEVNTFASTTGFYLMQENQSLVYRFCEMDKTVGCGDGIWTLVMKIDGEKPTFEFDSHLWRNSKPYNVEALYSGMQKTETKQTAFWDKPVQKLCLGMTHAGVTNWISTSFQASSLLSAISRKNTLTFGRRKWMSLLSPANIHEYCNMEGFELPECEDVRYVISFRTNGNDHCDDCDSSIGFGGTNPVCGDFHESSGGRAAFCYILIQ